MKAAVGPARYHVADTLLPAAISRMISVNAGAETRVTSYGDSRRHDAG